MQRWWRLYTRSDFRVINVLSGRRKEEGGKLIAIWIDFLPPSIPTPLFVAFLFPPLWFNYVSSSFFSFFLFFFFHFINDPPRFPSLDSWPLLDSASFYPVFVLWKNWTLGIAGPLRERAIFGTLANLETHFSSTRDALLTHRIYTIKNFVLLHTCFPRITRSLSLSISKGSFVQGRKFYSMIFLNERNVFGTIVGYRIFNEHPSTVPLRVRRRIPSIYEIKKKRKGKVIYMERKLFSLSRIFIERSND